MTNPEDAEATLAKCPPGLFLFNGTLCLKTEYGAMRCVPPFDVPGDQLRWTVSRYPDAYCVESGEYFWGGTDNHEDRANLIVQPIERASLTAKDAEIAALRAALEPFAVAWTFADDADDDEVRCITKNGCHGVDVSAFRRAARALHQNPESKA